MKVLDLGCANHHCFEGWFGSEADFQSQLARGLVECPICGDTTVRKLLSAPRLNLGAAPAAKQADAEGPRSVVARPDAAQQAVWLRAMRHLLASTEDVGSRFAEEARRIHYGEAQERAIRGRASRHETESLLEEGIAVIPLPLPPALESTEH